MSRQDSSDRSPRPGFRDALAAVERHEMPAVVTAFLLFFCVMSGYFSIRPVRDTIGSMMGRQNLADLWIVVWFASLAIIPIYGWVVGRFRRSVFLPWIYGSISAALLAVGLAFRDGEPSLFVGQFFWVFISVLNLFIISVFWSFLLEVFRSDQTRRLFGVIAAGGTAGALAGPLFTDLTVTRLGNTGILFVGAGLFGGAVVCQQLLIRIWRSHDAPADPAGAGEVGRDDRVIGGNPLAGIWIVARSPYLLAIALFVALLATASTFLYFEQLRQIEAVFPDPEARTRVFARLDWIVQSLTIVSQVLLTGWIASRFGLVVLLTMVPVATVLAYTTLAVWNTFAVLAVAIVARRFGEYAFVRPGREMLWSPLDKETKYKAKNFVDVPVYRGADAAVAQLQTSVEGAGFGPQTFAIMGAIAAAVWAVNGWWLGRRYDRNTATAGRDPQAIPTSSRARPLGARP